MSGGAVDNRCRSTDQEPREEDFGSQWKGSVEHKTAATEKCDRCPQRKSGARCTYILGHKAKPKRQRILISSEYKGRLEHISNKIDELGEIIKRLGDERRLGTPGFANPAELRVPSYSYEALQATVVDSSYGSVATERTSALNHLWTTVNVQRQKNETLEGSRPFPKELPSGFSLRDLPIPSLEKTMTYLRIAQESTPSQLYWPFEFGSLTEFTQYVIKACSPCPITDMELIIVHYVLSWLFTECSNRAVGDAVRRDYEVQALTCRDSLETIISSLSFHINTNMDSICAMYMAALHCLHCGRAFTARTFISRASLMSQALGLHSNRVVAVEPAEGVQRKISLFWAIYVREKSVSLRLGRPSTIRDQDITVPRLLMGRKMTSLAYHRMLDWIDVASLHGRVYDNLYSPNALEQPVSDRVSRAITLASELQQMIAARLEFYATNVIPQERPNQWTNHVIHPGLCRFIIHANRAFDYSTLASIYRGAPLEKPFSMVSCTECITAARAALEDSKVCISIVADAPTWPPSVDLWVNEILLLAPFRAFLILVCNIVGNSDPSDLERLQQLIDSLHSLARSPRYSSCIRQLRIFKASMIRCLRHLIGDQYTDLAIDTYLTDHNWPDIESELWKTSQFDSF
ncbi:hypothetical protein BDV23DRAFT_168622 [Aspergillus alliaceus]|uniref:Xylanolytic transcriptional activator regulatory domain-containing protein n=1 Tax=Petromyces alliaceus TaxID=209559 RepID=A0A5N7CNQ7_PETAA|nr:hypothetical protein BDV23DRAFT_168622 [Aspergillus alliaceus]